MCIPANFVSGRDSQRSPERNLYTELQTSSGLGDQCHTLGRMGEYTDHEQQTEFMSPTRVKRKHDR